MIDVYFVYSNTKDKECIMDSACSNFFIHFIDAGSYKGKKEAFKLKGSYGAKLDPFAIVLDNGKPIKAFYTENGNSVIKDLEKYLLAYEQK